MENANSFSTKREREETEKKKAEREDIQYNRLEEAVTQYLGAYIEKRQETVAKWVALQPIL